MTAVDVVRTHRPVPPGRRAGEPRDRENGTEGEALLRLRRGAYLRRIVRVISRDRFPVA